MNNLLKNIVNLSLISQTPIVKKVSMGGGQTK